MIYKAAVFAAYCFHEGRSYFIIKEREVDNG
jgi:hypothetical protein